MLLPIKCRRHPPPRKKESSQGENLRKRPWQARRTKGKKRKNERAPIDEDDVRDSPFSRTVVIKYTLGQKNQ